MRPPWNSDAVIAECRDYFMAHPIFVKLLSGFLEKYRSYGSFSGTVVLKNLKAPELELLEGFFGRSFHGKKSVHIRADHFEKALGESRFGAVSPKQLLEVCFGVAVESKKDEAIRRRHQWWETLEAVRHQCRGTLSRHWLDCFCDGPDSFPVLVRRLRMMEADMKSAQRLLGLCVHILEALPVLLGMVEYRTVFAARLTGNPHAFDDDTPDGRLLGELIQWYAHHEKGGQTTQSQTAQSRPAQNQADVQRLFPALKKQRTFLQASILLDDLSNYTMLYGVRAVIADGAPHAGMEGFFSEGDAVLVPLSAIARFKTVQCVDNTIYVVENPSVFAAFCGYTRKKRSCMCMNGQPRLSSLMMMDLLAAAGVRVYYAGDFDPEGLLIAQKLCQYYPGIFEYWHMSEDDCAASLSERTISRRRLKMLERINDPKLLPAVNILRREGRAGYQERIMNRYLLC